MRLLSLPHGMTRKRGPCGGRPPSTHASKRCGAVATDPAASPSKREKPLAFAPLFARLGDEGVEAGPG
jgi:hypothetical protein